MQRVIWHPDLNPDVGPMEQRGVLDALQGQTGCVMRSVILDSGVLCVDLRVHTFMAPMGFGYALVAIGRTKSEMVVLTFDSLDEAIAKYMRVVERCEQDPLCRVADRPHAWDMTDHHLVPCNEAKAA